MRITIRKHKRLAARIVAVAVLLVYILNIAVSVMPEEWKTEVLVGVGLLVLFLILEEFLAVEEKIESMSLQLTSRLDTRSYSDPEFFSTVWARLRKTSEYVTVVGDFAFYYVEQIKQLCAQGTRVSVFVTLDTRFASQVFQLVDLYKSLPVGQLRVYHVGKGIWDSLVIWHDEKRKETEIAINFGTLSQEMKAGLHLTGNAAHTFTESMRPYIADPAKYSVVGELYEPVLVDTKEKADFIMRRRFDFQQEMAELRNGVPKNGVEEICKCMSGLLERTGRYLFVTHVASVDSVSGDSILLMEKDIYQNWIAANFAATKRGVEIVRIFLVRQQDFQHPVLQRVMDDMQSHGIHVLWHSLEDLGANLVRDFSIYDGKHLVYIYKSPKLGAWLGTQATARHTVDPKTIDEYQSVFELIRAGAQKPEARRATAALPPLT